MSEVVMANRCVYVYVLLFMLVTTAGCATAPTAESKRTSDQFCRHVVHPRRSVCIAGQIPAASVAAQAANLPAASEALTLYVLRNNSADPTELVRLEVGGQVLTETLTRTFVRIRLPPGEHVVTVGWRTGATSHTIQGSAGEVKYLQLTGRAFMGSREFGFKDIERTRALELARDAVFVADLAPQGAP